jgi:hypothetical protein
MTLLQNTHKRFPVTITVNGDTVAHRWPDGRNPLQNLQTGVEERRQVFVLSDRGHRAGGRFTLRVNSLPTLAQILGRFVFVLHALVLSCSDSHGGDLALHGHLALCLTSDRRKYPTTPSNCLDFANPSLPSHRMHGPFGHQLEKPPPLLAQLLLKDSFSCIWIEVSPLPPTPHHTQCGA